MPDKQKAPTIKPVDAPPARESDDDSDAEAPEKGSYRGGEVISECWNSDNY
jgi:hypothetical protein